MQGSLVNLLLVVVTILIALSVFSLFAFFTSIYSGESLSQEYVIGLSKSVQVITSFPAYKSGNLVYITFNVSYLFWVKAPVKTVTIIPFVSTAQNNPFYLMPVNPQEACLYSSTPKGYKQINGFLFSSNVYLPQGGQLLGKVSNVYAYNVSSNQTYILSALISPNQIIYFWILYYYQGKWYRLDYTYFNPFNNGLPVYFLSSSGKYNSNSAYLKGAPEPHITMSNTGFMMGMWFEPIAIATNPNMLLNATFIPVGNSNGNGNQPFSIVLYQVRYLINATIYNGNNYYSSAILSQIQLNQWYYINFSFGSQLNSEGNVNFNMYSLNGISSSPISLGLPSGTTNGYVLIVSFGSKSLTTDAISQAFFATLQNNPGENNLYSASSIMLNNGYITHDYNYYYSLMSQSQNSLYALGYWYFVYLTNTPPSQVPGILWYYPNGNIVLLNATIPETGYNTYIA